MGGFRARGTTNRCTPHPIENRARPMTVWLEVRQVAHLLQTLYADYSHKLRRRKGSGDLPGLQSRRFGSSRAEWWVRLPHASAISGRCQSNLQPSGKPRFAELD